MSTTTGRGHIQVCVRVRPLSTLERKSVVGRIAWRWGHTTENSNTDTATANDHDDPTIGNAAKSTASDDDDSSSPSSAPKSYIEQIWYPPGQGNTRLRAQFFFDRLFGPKISTAPVYSAVGANIVRACTLQGYHGAIFAYGQTSTGKTFTMQGSATSPGLIPLAVRDVFAHVQSSPREFVLRVSYLEIYNETVNDLLRPSSVNLRIFDDPQRGVVIKGLEETLVVSADQIFSLITAGESHRHVGSTNFNYRSSRSHTIFRMVIESRRSGSGSKGSALVSSLSLVDLAGSESASASSRRSKKRRAEGGYINKSLLTLSHIILKLSDAQSESSGGGGGAAATASSGGSSQASSSNSASSTLAHLPYRDSKLTRILKPALDGHSMMSIICTMTPSAVNFGESLNTLKFASRAKRIVSHAIINRVDDETALIIKYQTEIAKLKSELSLAQQEAKLVQQQRDQQQLQLQQQQRHTTALLNPPRPLLSREEALKNRELRNALKQAIANIGRVILNSKQSQHHQTSTAASRLRRRQRRNKKGNVGEKNGAAAPSTTSSTSSRKRRKDVKKSAPKVARAAASSTVSSGESARPTQQAAGDEQEQQRGSSTAEGSSGRTRRRRRRTHKPEGDARDAAAVHHHHHHDNDDGDAQVPVLTATAASSSNDGSSSDVGSSSEGESGSSSESFSSYPEDDEEGEEDDEGDKNIGAAQGTVGAPGNTTPRFFQRRSDPFSTAVTKPERSSSPSTKPLSSGSGGSDLAPRAVVEASPSMSPAMAHIHKQIESSQMDSLLLTEARGAGGFSSATAAADVAGDKASIQSELDGIRAHLTSLLQQIAHTGGGQEDEAHDEESASSLQFQSSMAKMPPSTQLLPHLNVPHLTTNGRADSTDSIPDFRGRKSGDLEGLLSSTYYAAGGETVREESLNLKQQVLSLQKKVEEQALKFSVTKADSSFLTEVLAQKDKILNECQLLLIELDARYQGVTDRCAMLEATLRRKDERIYDLEVLAGVRKAGSRKLERGSRSGEGDWGGGSVVGGRTAAQQETEELTKNKNHRTKRRSSHKKLIQWVGMDPGGLRKKAEAVDARDGGGGGGGGDAGRFPDGGNDLGTSAPSYSNLMDKLSELQVQLRTSPLKTAANVVIATNRLRTGRNEAVRREPKGDPRVSGDVQEGGTDVLVEESEDEKSGREKKKKKRKKRKKTGAGVAMPAATKATKAAPESSSAAAEEEEEEEEDFSADEASEMVL